MILERLAQSSPIYFMIASVYFENRFEFYDLVVKRALLILLSVIVLGVFLALTLPWLQQLPDGAGAPVAVRRRPGAGGDGDAVADVAHRTLAGSHVAGPRVHAGGGGQARLAAMQPATDEQTLIAAAEARLSEIFGAKIVVRVGGRRDRSGDRA